MLNGCSTSDLISSGSAAHWSKLRAPATARRGSSRINFSIAGRRAFASSIPAGNIFLRSGEPAGSAEYPESHARKGGSNGSAGRAFVSSARGVARVEPAFAPAVFSAGEAAMGRATLASLSGRRW